MIEVTIPGEPYAQKRARAARVGKGVRVYDPAANRNWKATAQQYMRDAMMAAGRFGEVEFLSGKLEKHLNPLAGPVRLTVLALFSMPRSRWRKRVPRPAERHVKKPELDNIIKAVQDAGNGILWLDDRQVCELTARKWTLAQGEPGRLEIMVQEVTDD